MTQQGSFSRSRQQKKPYDRPQHSTPENVRCFECCSAHFKRNFPNLVEVKTEERRCYICNKPGHFANTCPEKKSGRRSQQQKAYGEKPQAAGQVFALSGVEATRSACVKELGLSTGNLGCELVVATPTSVLSPSKEA
ncbi:unnamed protein product, partial [Sphenostylis stenocarpa]